MSTNSKVRKHISISESTNEEIIRLAKLNGAHHSHVVERALKYYFKHQGQEYPELHAVLESLMIPVHEELTRLRITTNKNDKALSMLLEFSNHYLATENEHPFVTTERNKTEEFSLVEKLVNEKIGAKRQTKLSGRS